MRSLDPAQTMHDARAAFGAGDYAAALACARAAIAQRPDAVDALVLGVNAALRCDALDSAIAWLQTLLRSHPQNAQFRRMLSTAHNNLGSRELHLGHPEPAFDCWNQALQVWPDNPQARFNRARHLVDHHRPADALTDLQHLLNLHPDDHAAAALHAQIVVHQLPDAQSTQLTAALHTLSALTTEALQRAALHADASDAQGAIAACMVDARPADALALLAHRLADNADAVAGRAAFARSAALLNHGQLEGGLRACIGERLLLPQVYASAADLQAQRQQFTEGLQHLHARFDERTLSQCDPSLDQLRWTNFLLAYQGHNDLQLQRSYAGFLARALDIFVPQLREPPGRRRAGAARIGFLTSAFRDSTVGAYFGSWPRICAAAGHHVEIFQLGPVFDEVTARIGAAVSKLHRLDGSMLGAARTIRAADLDLLIYPDLGADARIVPLASLCLARQQVAAWGQPTTTGSDRIDAFLSCAEMEPADCAAHYIETLLLLPGIGTRYARPEVPPVIAREKLGMPQGNLYLVPQSPFKIHPDADALLAGIAASDPDAVLLLFAADRPGTTRLLHARLASALESAGADPQRQLRFLAQVARPAFLQICAACTVMVDTPHWSGGNTTIDALVSGLPVVTVPGALMRGRQSMAMLRQLGVDELICADTDGLIRTAIELARDAPRRDELRRRIAIGLEALLQGEHATQVLSEHLGRMVAAAMDGAH